MSGYSVTPLLQTDLYTAIIPWLQTVTGLGAGLVTQGRGNRAAMPLPVPGFVLVQAIGARRLRTNVTTWDTVGNNPTTLNLEQGTEIKVQIDFYGPSAWDWAIMVQALQRSDAAVAALGPNLVPLYTEEPFLGDLDDSEDQYELRCILTAYFQYNPVVTQPQTFAQAGAITLIDIDESYPP